MSASSPHTATTISVIGAGLGRTGTASLKIALETLLGRPCYHMLDLQAKHLYQSGKWLEIDRTLEEKGEICRIDQQVFHELLDGYSSVVDYPGCCYYYQMMLAYPDAKVVLTVRDADTWVQSVRATIFPKRGTLGQLAHYLVRIWSDGLDFYLLIHAIFRRTLGPNVDLSNNAQLSVGFTRWIEKVKTSVPADRLLVYRVEDGWEPLCTFLQLPVPQEEFPHQHRRIEGKMCIRKRALPIKTVEMTLPIIGLAVTVLFAYLIAVQL